MKRLALIPLLFVLAGCASTTENVNWDNYSQSVKERIVSMTDNKDCDGLQNEFDIAYENDDAQRSRTGEGNADLLRYLDETMKEIGCY